jgi:putative glycosyltransferase (TIGR04372 family)
MPRIIRILKRIYLNRLEIALLPFHLLLAIYLRLFTNIEHHHIGQANRIGYYSYYFNIYFARRGPNQKWTRTQIFTLSKPIANELTMAKFAKGAWILYNSSLYLKIFAHILKPFDSFDIIDFGGELLTTEPWVKLTEAEQNDGYKRAIDAGIPVDKLPIVLIFNRDSGYLPTTYNFPMNFEYHSYRDYPIDSMYEATKALIDLGYHVVRVGRNFTKKTDWDLKEFTDYTMLEPNDLLELYLFSLCKFSVGTASGLASFPMLFRKPQVWTNVVPVAGQPYTKTTNIDIIMPKTHVSRDDNCPINASKIAKLGAGVFGQSSEYDNAGIDVVNNSPDDIRDAAIEMHQRISENYTPSDETLKKQNKYFSYIAPNLADLIKAGAGKKVSVDHWSWDLFEKNLSHKRAFPNVVEAFINRNPWMHN